MFPSKATTITARTFILRRSGTYQNQYHRNYATDASMGQVGALIDTIAADRITTVTPALLGTIGYDMLGLSTRVTNETPVALPNDWGTRRGIFILALEVVMNTGGRLNYYVQGYTDNDNFSDRAVDPNMRLYVNNVVTAVPTQERTAMGNINSMRVASNFQTPMDFSTAHGFSPNPMVMARPQDIFGQMKNNDLSTQDIFVTDRGNAVASNLVSSRRRNNLPTSFMASVFNGFSSGRMETHAADFTAGDVAENAFNTVLEKDAVTDLFLTKLREANGLSRGQSHFTYAELMRAVPNLEMVRAPMSNSSAGTQLSQAGDSNHFKGQTISTLCAVQLASAIPALMLECMLSTVHITISNMVDGQLQMRPLGVPGCFAPEIAERQFTLFRDRVMREVIYPMTHRGVINFHANISCSFHSEVVIDIRVGDDPDTHFVTPAFCDSLFSPAVSNDPNVVRELTNHLTVLCDHVSEAINDAQMSKERIISRELVAPMTGALSSNNNAFGIPPVVNTGPSYTMPINSPSVGHPAGYSGFTNRPSGPSATSM